MSARSLRPRVSQLVLTLYDRPIHPELVEIVAMRTIECADYALTLQITPIGHLISWDSDAGHLTEITAPEDHPLPIGGRLLQRRLNEERTETLVPTAGLCYHFGAQVEELPLTMFPQVHEELLTNTRHGLLHQFQIHHRFAISPATLMMHDNGEGYVSIAAFHTFPDECTILKTQTLIEHQRGHHPPS